MHGIAPQAVWRVRPQGLFRSCRAAFAWRTTHTTTCPTARRQGRPFPLVERAPCGRAGMACHGHRIAESAVAQPKRRSRGVSGLLRDTRATVLEHARVPRAPCIRRNAGSPTRSHNSPACAVLYIAPQAPLGCSLPSCADRHASAASSCMGETRDARCATFHAVCCCTLANAFLVFVVLSRRNGKITRRSCCRADLHAQILQDGRDAGRDIRAYLST